MEWCQEDYSCEYCGREDSDDIYVGKIKLETGKIATLCERCNARYWYAIDNGYYIEYDYEGYLLNIEDDVIERNNKAKEIKRQILASKINKALLNAVHNSQPKKETEEERLKRETEEKKKEEERKKAEEEKAKKERLEKRKQLSAPFDRLIGMHHIKKEVDNWLIRMDGMERLKKNSKIVVENPPKNIVITGTSGVGKTKLARMLTDIFFEMGIIKEKKLIETKTDELVAEYVGHTAQKTKKKIQEALGGVFFLDEAYRLSSGSFTRSKDEGNFGKEAIETIMPYLDDPNNKTVFIFVGYPDKMDEFLGTNEGLRSRIKDIFKLQDYTLDELKKIGISQLTSKGYKVDVIEDILEEYLSQKMPQGILKGNARTLTNFINKVIDNHMTRISKDETITDYETILPIDVENAFKNHDMTQEGLKKEFMKAKEKIDKLTGLKTVKEEINRIGNFQYIQNKRKSLGMKSKSKANHMALLGNAGTGKTTFARLVGHLFRGAGVLSNGHFVEASKDLLTAGESIPKTVKSLVNKALGGILFIDEAYNLRNDMKGKEALDALIPLMENHRDDFICILAGYTDDMNSLFYLNQGLASRIPYHFYFEDYSVDELFEIMIRKIADEEYILEESAVKKVKSSIEIFKKANLVNGNARWVRNVFEKFISFQSDRLVEIELKDLELKESDFSYITSEDVINVFSTLYESSGISLYEKGCNDFKTLLTLEEVKMSLDKLYA